MGTSRRWKLGVLGFSAVFGAIVALEVGCGSDSFTSDTSTDGGSEDSATGDGGTSDGALDSAQGCLPVPSVQPGDVAFCNAFAEIYEKCGSCENCRKNDVNNCAAFSAAFSDAFRNAIVSCKDKITDCDALQSQTFGASPCVDDAMRGATATKAAEEAKTAYCATCADAGPGTLDCDHFFFDVDGGATSGTVLLYVSDNIGSDIQANCSAPLYCNNGLYGLCEAGQLCSGKHSAPKTTCMQGLCK